MRNLSYRLMRSLPVGLRMLFLRPWYEYISRLDSAGEVVFMNYGYHESENAPISLDHTDEPNRYPIQLYEKLIAGIALEGTRILEVGSGRGGGASYVARSHKPAMMIGVDLTRGAIEFSKRANRLPNLEFEHGDAQELKFPDASFDVVLNLESSHCYPHVERFFSEVLRVLKAGGHFCYADWRNKSDVPEVEAVLLRMGYVVLEANNLNPGILAAIELDHERKAHLIRKHAPHWLQPVFEEFSGVKNSRSFDIAFRRGERVYYRYLLQKPQSG